MNERDAEFVEIMMQDGDWQPGSRMHRLALLARRGAEAAARIEQLEAALREIKRGAVWNADIETFISSALEERSTDPSGSPGAA